jgi:hypothetical protein
MQAVRDFRIWNDFVKSPDLTWIAGQSGVSCPALKLGQGPQSLLPGFIAHVLKATLLA